MYANEIPIPQEDKPPQGEAAQEPEDITTTDEYVNLLKDLSSMMTPEELEIFRQEEKVKQNTAFVTKTEVVSNGNTSCTFQDQKFEVKLPEYCALDDSSSMILNQTTGILTMHTTLKKDTPTNLSVKGNLLGGDGLRTDTTEDDTLAIVNEGNNKKSISLVADFDEKSKITLTNLGIETTRNVIDDKIIVDQSIADGSANLMFAITPKIENAGNIRIKGNTNNIDNANNTDNAANVGNRNAADALVRELVPDTVQDAVNNVAVNLDGVSSDLRCYYDLDSQSLDIVLPELPFSKLDADVLSKLQIEGTPDHFNRSNVYDPQENMENLIFKMAGINVQGNKESGITNINIDCKDTIQNATWPENWE